MAPIVLRAVLLFILATMIEAMVEALRIIDHMNALINESFMETEMEVLEQRQNDEHLIFEESNHMMDMSTPSLAATLMHPDAGITEVDLSGSNFSQWYIRPRSYHWWIHFQETVMPTDPSRFKEMFRISIDTYLYICDLLFDDLQRNPPFPLSTIPGRHMSVRIQVAIGLRRLASAETLLSLSEQFGVGKSTISRITKLFVDALLSQASHHLKWPDQDEMVRVKRGFQSLRGLPNCCGAIDCTHVIIDLPSNELEVDWYDRTKRYSMIVQAVVDHRTKFLDVMAGIPGSVNDMRVLRVSSFKALVEDGHRLNGPVMHRNNQPIREYIIGDAGYPLMPWLVVPYPGKKLTPLCDKFNFMHSSTRMSVERAFGLLKKSWQYLETKVRLPNLDTLSKSITACCMLHNIMIDRGDRYVAQVYADVDDKDYHHDKGYEEAYRGQPPLNDGVQLRETLANCVWNIH